jgi:AcrR family transcriptional regulator
MARAFRQQIDQGILDRAAGLFARYGFTQTSVQAVADAVGMSKAGLLHYFPSKDALCEAVLAANQALEHEVIDQVAGMAPGAARDRIALETLVDQALARPGLVAFCLASAAADDNEALRAAGAEDTILQAFGVEAGTGAERRLRVIGALGALSVLVLVVHHSGKSSAWRPHVIATSFDALGYPRAAGA